MKWVMSCSTFVILALLQTFAVLIDSQTAGLFGVTQQGDVSFLNRIYLYLSIRSNKQPHAITQGKLMSRPSTLKEPTLGSVGVRGAGECGNKA
jgi:hypothetical protein